MPVSGSGPGKPRMDSRGRTASNCAAVRCRRRATFSAGMSAGSTLKRTDGALGTKRSDAMLTSPFVERGIPIGRQTGMAIKRAVDRFAVPPARASHSSRHDPLPDPIVEGRDDSQPQYSAACSRLSPRGVMPRGNLVMRQPATLKMDQSPPHPGEPFHRWMKASTAGQKRRLPKSGSRFGRPCRSSTSAALVHDRRTSAGASHPYRACAICLSVAYSGICLVIACFAVGITSIRVRSVLLGAAYAGL